MGQDKIVWIRCPGTVDKQPCKKKLAKRIGPSKFEVSFLLRFGKRAERITVEVIMGSVKCPRCGQKLDFSAVPRQSVFAEVVPKEEEAKEQINDS